MRRAATTVMAPALALFALPAPAAAQTAPLPCRIVAECFGTTCGPHTMGVVLMFDDRAEGMTMFDAVTPDNRMVLAPVAGAGTDAWVGRSPRTRGTVMVSRMPGERRVMTVHNDAQEDLTMVTHLDCSETLPEPPPILSK